MHANLNTEEVRGADFLQSCKFEYNIRLGLCVHGSSIFTAPQTQICCSYDVTLCFFFFKSAYKWTRAVQIHVFQGSAVYVCICLSQYDYVCKSVWVVLSVSVCMLFSNN